MVTDRRWSVSRHATGIVDRVHGQPGGGGGIRTPETLARLAVFKTAAFNHSATPPRRGLPVPSAYPGCSNSGGSDATPDARSAVATWAAMAA